MWKYKYILNIFFFSLCLFLSPSGCTFWGKKPWSRKKKILWQLGTLVGAPVGIALIAGIAIPAMIIGIPVYVGRKVRLWKHIHIHVVWNIFKFDMNTFGSVTVEIYFSKSRCNELYGLLWRHGVAFSVSHLMVWLISLPSHKAWL